MNLDRLVAGLDIGSAKTTAVIAEVVGDLPKHPTVNILGVGQSRTTGLRKGVVADIEETMRSITKAMQDAERMAGAQVESVYAGIAGEHVQAMTSTGIASVTTRPLALLTSATGGFSVTRTTRVPGSRRPMRTSRTWGCSFTRATRGDTSSQMDAVVSTLNRETISSGEA